MALTRKLTKSLTRPLTRKLTGAELEQLFLEKFKFTTSNTELVTNGTFDADSNWTKGTGWTIGSGVATHASGTSSGLDQAFTFQSGKTYDITFDVVACSGGSGSVQARGNGSTAAQTIDASTIGANTFRYTDTTNHNTLRFDAGSGTTLTVDNVSVKEVTKQAPLAAFSLRKLGDVSPYACRIRRSSDNTEAQVMFDASDRVSESSVVINTSQNLIPFSEQFSLSDWVKFNISVTPSSITDPFGGTNAYKYAEASTASNNKLLLDSHAVSSGKSYTLSLYAKKGELEIIQLILGNVTFAGGNNHANFNLTTGTVTATGGGCIPRIEAIGDDWYRISITDTTSASGNVQPTIVLHNSATGARASSYTGNGTDGVYIFGCQSEETVTYESTGTEKLTDGGFDNGLASWTAGGDSSLLSVENGAIRLHTTDGTYTDIHQFHAVTAGKKYEYRADLTFTQDSGNNGAVALGQDYNSSYTQTTHNTSGSILVTRVATATDSSTKFYIKRAGTPTNVLIDNLSVLEFDPIPSEYISTPVISNDGLTFTESTLDTFVGGENLLSYSEDIENNWNKYSFGGASRTFDDSQTDPFGGTNASKIEATNADTSTGGTLLTREFSAVQNQVYVLSVYLKGQNGGETVQIDFKNQGSSGIGGSSVTLTTEWQRFSAVFTSDATATRGLQLRLIGSASNQDFYFFGGQVNNDSLKTYQKTTGTARDGNASVVVLYNQTGGEDAIQATSGNQPLLYKGGLLVSSGTSPAMEFDGTNDYLPFSSDFNDDLNLNSLSASVVFQTDYPTQTAGILLFLGGSSGGNKRWYQPFINGSKFKYSYGTNHPATEETANTDHNIVTFVAGASGTSGLQVYRNGTHVNNHTATLIDNSNDTDPAGIGAYGQGSLHYKGKFQEAIIFDSDQKSNREAIESDIANFHNITLS